MYVPITILLDFGAHVLMLGKIACISLEVWRSKLETYPFKIQTSLGGANDRSYFMTKESLSVHLKHDDARDSSQFEICICRLIC